MGSLSLASSKINKGIICDSYVSHVGKNGSLKSAISWNEEEGQEEISQLSWFSRSTKLSKVQHCQGRNLKGKIRPQGRVKEATDASRSISPLLCARHCVRGPRGHRVNSDMVLLWGIAEEKIYERKYLQEVLLTSVVCSHLTFHALGFCFPG